MFRSNGLRLGKVLSVELAGLSDLKMADGLMTLVDELNLQVVLPLAREVSDLEAEGARGRSYVYYHQ